MIVCKKYSVQQTMQAYSQTNAYSLKEEKYGTAEQRTLGRLERKSAVVFHAASKGHRTYCEHTESSLDFASTPSASMVNR